MEIKNTEVLYTYAEWKAMEQKKREERTYYVKQKVISLLLIMIAIIAPFVLDGDMTFFCFAFPIGLYLIFTKEKMMDFDT